MRPFLRNNTDCGKNGLIFGINSNLKNNSCNFKNSTEMNKSQKLQFQKGIEKYLEDKQVYNMFEDLLN